MNNFVDLFVLLESWGVRDSILPFMFVFVLVFAILEKVKILGSQAKKFNIVIAIIFGLLFVIPHVMNYYPYGNYDPVQIVNDSIPDVSLTVIFIFLFFLLVATLSGKGPEAILSPSMTKFILLGAAIAVVFIFGGNAGWWETGLLNGITSEDIGNVAIILFFLFLIYYVTKGEEGERQHKVEFNKK